MAAALHICVIVGGASWYRFFGAGETMVVLAERGSLRPAFITLGVTLVLLVWGLYAWSGAGLLPKMPFLKLGLVTVTTIYLVRGLGGLIAPFVSDHPQISQNSVSFWVWSSIVCLAIGMVHLFGIVSKWSVL